MPSTLTIGSDPELQLVSPLTGERVSANSFIHGDTLSIPFGCDGHSSTAELRPGIANDPIEHARQIKNLLLNHAKQASYQDVFRLNFFCSDFDESIGGHIHLGHPLIAYPESGEASGSFLIKVAKEMGISDKDIERGGYHLSEMIHRKINDNRSLLAHNLDMLCAFPLMFTEVTEHARRRKGHYGHLSDFRAKDYGIEYRTTPCWLATQRLAEGALSLAYVVANETLNKNYHPKENFTLFTGFQDEFMRHNTQLLTPYIDKVHSELRKMELYPRYKPYIEYVIYHAKKQDELLQHEVKSGWKIPYAIIRNITLLTVKDLVNKVSMALSVPKSARDESHNNIPYMTFGTDDYMIPQITSNINTCLNTVIDEKTLDRSSRINGVYLFAKKREDGDVVTIKINMFRANVDVEKLDRLPRLIDDIAKSFNYPNKITVKMENTDYSNQGSDRVNHLAKVGIGRAIREQSTYLAEAIAFTVLLYINNSIYQAYSVDRRTGKRVTHPIRPSTIVKAIKDNLADKVKTLPQQTQDHEEAEEEQRRNVTYTDMGAGSTSSTTV
jgi:hypothetical protein